MTGLCLFAAFMHPDTTWCAESGATSDASVFHGSITADAAWAGRLAVDGMVTVESGATLTIRPGTEIRFTPTGGLTVKGVMRADGTAEKPVIFLPAAEGQELWAGITLGSAAAPSLLRSCRIARAAGVTISLGAHRIEGCEISGGRVGIFVSGPEAKPVITGNRITDMDEAGIQCSTRSGPTVADNVLERCGVGISAQFGAAPLVRGNRISGCETGIEIVQTPPRVSGNTVTGCSRGIVLSSSSGGEPVRGNRVEGNETGILCQLSSAAEISGNTIVKNRDGLVCIRFAQPLVRNNDILDNATGITCSKFSDATISANSIARNGRGVFLTLNSFAAVHGNNLEDNGMHVEESHVSLAYERRETVKPPRGRFQQNKMQVERGMALPLDTKDVGLDRTGLTVDFSGNWWGEATTREMAEKGPDANISSIHDGYDLPRGIDEDGNLQEKIVYAPWAKQRIGTAGVPVP